MAQEKIEEIIGLIEKHFDFLFERGAEVISSDYGGGNFAIVLETTDLRLRFARDRGTITVQVGPLWATAGWSGEPWYDLIIVVAFLTQKQVLISGYWEDRFKADKQLERLAEAFLFYYDQIVELFRTDTFYEKKGSLDLVGNDIVSLLFDPHRRSERQKLLEQSNWFWQQTNSS